MNVYYNKVDKKQNVSKVNIYPYPESILDEDVQDVLAGKVFSFFENKDVRFTGKLQEMQEKAIKDNKPSNVEDFIDAGKIINVKFNYHTITLTKDDLDEMINDYKYIEEIYSTIGRNKSNIIDINTKWKLVYDLENTPEILDRLAYYQTLKYFCNNNKLKFENKTFDFLEIPIDEFILMRRLYLKFKDDLGWKVFELRTNGKQLPQYNIDVYTEIIMKEDEEK